MKLRVENLSFSKAPVTRGIVITMGGLLFVFCCVIGFSLTQYRYSSAPAVSNHNSPLPKNTDASLQQPSQETVHQPSADVPQAKNDHSTDNAVSSDEVASKSETIAEDNSSNSVVAIDDNDTMNAYAPLGSGLDDTPIDINTLQNTILSANDLADKSLRALSLSHSTIYALHGCNFTRPAINSYFQSQPWYHPASNFTEAMLSDVERANAQTIRAMERSHFNYGRHSFDEQGQYYQAARDPLKETAAPGSGQTDQLLDLDTLQHRIVTDEDLSGRSLAALSISYNAIYAAHGYVFKRPSLQQLFSRLRWYTPNPGFREQDLSSIEQANLKTIRGYERTHFGF